MTLIDSLERKYGRFAIPHLVRTLATLQLLTFGLIKFTPAFFSMISLNKFDVLHGEVWRLFTWVLYPGTLHWVWILFVTMMLIVIGDELEAAWGPFRVNLYIFGGMLAVIIQTWFFPGAFDIPDEVASFIPKQTRAMMSGMLQPAQVMWFDSTILFAFACILPEYELFFAFVVPIKVKWLALLDAGWMLLTFIDTPMMRIPLLFSILNFATAFGPAGLRAFIHHGKVMERRSRFDAARKSESAAFHQCANCKKTELDDKNLDFRVTADGEEYCTVCRPRANA
jgi:hypothetical protein